MPRWAYGWSRRTRRTRSSSGSWPGGERANYRSAIERLRGVAWIDVEGWDVADARLPMVKRVVTRGELKGTKNALTRSVEMVADYALKMAAYATRSQQSAGRRQKGKVAAR